MNNYTKIILKSGKEKSLQRYHPWVFTGAIEAITHELRNGDIVEIFDSNKKYLATGHYQDEGSIAVKIFSFNNCIPNKPFWKDKIKKAIDLRKNIGFFENEFTNVFRLIHGEGDNMPGLIADYYNGNIVIQFHTQGMNLLKDIICESILELLGDKVVSIFNKSDNTLSKKAETGNHNEILFGKIENDIIVKENGNQYIIDIVEGQKTGFFIDQRENRKLLELYCKDKKVLNVFGYTGGFSVAALKGGAKMVHSIDSSVKAIELTNKNIELNFGKTDRHLSFITDAFEFLDKIDNDYDVIILDPPAFAKQLHLKDKALKGYRNINNKVINSIKNNGLLFTFSCSQAISKDDFRTMIFSASALTGKNAVILHQLSQGADHPINIYHPESEYLKGLCVNINNL